MASVTAVFDRYEDASWAVNNLEAAGIPRSEINIVANNAEQRHTEDRASNASADAGIGAVAAAAAQASLLAWV